MKCEKDKFPYIVREVSKRLRGGNIKNKPSGGLYRVRKYWSDTKSQKAAFRNLDNAKKCADRFGLKVYDENGKVVYPTGKTIDQLAREVIIGNWGNGDERERSLCQFWCRHSFTLDILFLYFLLKMPQINIKLGVILVSLMI